MQFDRDYREEATLEDGTRVVLRMLRREDKELLRRGFERLSPRSRYLRFFTRKMELSDKELARLVDVDQVDRVALGAVKRDADGNEEGLGIARFTRLKDDPEVAEPAVTVIDDYQGRGLGTLLLQRLIVAAKERGIKRFRSEVLDENDRMRLLIEEIWPGAWFLPSQQGVVVVEMPLPKAWRGKKLEPEGAEGFLHRIFSHIASDNILVQMGEEIIDYLTGGDRNERS